MTNGLAKSKGGSIYSGGDGTTTITFTNCATTVKSFSATSTSDGYGGFMYIDNAQTSFSSSSCNYESMFAKYQGGFIYGNNLKNFDL